jgi:hypothetical protein
VLLHLGLVLQQILDSMSVRHVSSFLYPRPVHHPLFPSLQIWELINIDACPACRSYPAPVCDISDGAFALALADQILAIPLSKVLVNDAVQSPSLVLVAVDTVLDWLWSISREVIRLVKSRSLAVPK